MIIKCRSIDAYREAAQQSGFDTSELPVATSGLFYAAETSQQALRDMYPHVNIGMKRTNGQGFSKQLFAQGPDPHNVLNIGSPQEIIEKILYQHELFGHQRYIAQIDFGGVLFDKVMKNIELIGTEIILKLPIVPLEKLIVFIASLNFWGSIAATFVGIIIGLILTAIIFSENLKVVIIDSNMSLIKGDNTNIVIDKQDISSVYIEDKTLVILGLAGEELYRGTFDRNSDTAQDAFLYHHYPWRDKDSFIHEYQKWNLEHISLSKEINSLLYSRRVALREGEKKEAEHLRKDLSELGIVIRDQGYHQYFRKVKK